MWMDLLISARVLRRAPLFAVGCILTLACVVAATVSVFSVVDATLLRPLPFTDPDRLVSVRTLVRDANGQEAPFPPSQIELVRWGEGAHSLAALEAIESRTMAMGATQPEMVRAGAITSGLFTLLGRRPMVGRIFTADEERQDAGVALLSEGLWRSRFGGTADAVGQDVVLSGRAYRIVGVMPAAFNPVTDPTEIWIPLHPKVDPSRQGNRLLLTVVGRLAPGASAAAAADDLLTISRAVAREFPLGSANTRPLVMPLQEALFGNRRPALTLLTIAVAGLLALGCANVANLTLAHVSGRRAELSTRALIGASRWQLARPLLVQTALVSAAGGLLGTLAARQALPSLMALYNRDGLARVPLTDDWRLLLLGGAAILVTATLCAVLPALRVHRAVRAGDGARLASTRVSGGPWERRLRGALVAAQIALAIGLLSGSGTLLVSLDRLLATDMGFSPQHVLSTQILLPPAAYPDAPSRARFVQRLLENVAAIPGVESVGTTQSTFLPGQSMRTSMYVEGAPETEPERSHIRHITPGYFRTLGIRVLDGRPIEDRDVMGAPPVCMVSRSFADKYWPQGNAVGHRVRRAGATATWMTIVGVVDDIRDDGLATEPGPILYVPYLQFNTPTARVSLLVRTGLAAEAVAPEVRRAIWAADPRQYVDRVAPLEGLILEGTAEPRFRTLLLALFAGAGVLLAVVGVYAVAAVVVASRRWEAGLKLALGASPVRVMLTVLREFGLLIAAGGAAGLMAYTVASQALSAVVYQTGPRDPWIVTAATGAVAVLALAAALVQARRLSRVSPLAALRGE